MAWIAAAYAAFLIAIAVYDVRRQRIPNVAVYPAIAVALVVAFVRPDGAWWSFLLAGLAAAAFFIALGVITHGAMGGGDVKLVGLIGLVAGWPGVFAPPPGYRRCLESCGAGDRSAPEVALAVRCTLDPD